MWERIKCKGGKCENRKCGTKMQELENDVSMGPLPEFGLVTCRLASPVFIHYNMPYVEEGSCLTEIGTAAKIMLCASINN